MLRRLARSPSFSPFLCIPRPRLKLTTRFMKTNPELELAFRYLSNTNRHLFLTGKAGTGKTTFLHRVKREIPKRMAVVAPTGVAAINAKG